MSKPFSILIVDDSLPELTALRELLETAGYTVTMAQSGRQAINAVYQAPPDLILSDILMPEINGYHLCRILKSDPLTHNIPIVLLSGPEEKHNLFWGQKAGADFFLEKTADGAALLEGIRPFLSIRPEQALQTTPAPENPDGKDIRNRITGILDRLLYESTISNEILKLTSLAHDPTLLAGELLHFISLISRYSAAGLLLREGPNKYLICLQLIEPVSTGFIEHARKEILRRAELDDADRTQHRFVLIERDKTAERVLPAGFHVIGFLPIRDDRELLASITLFESGQRRLSDGMRHSLDIIADRFLVVARYLKKIREIENVKADLVSMLVHDMRSPLTGISGFTNVLAEGILGQLSGDQREALKNIQEGCRRLLQLIDDILDYSKLEAGKMQVFLKPLDILPLVHQTVLSMSMVLHEHGLTIATDIPAQLPRIMGDEKQLIRVLGNLVNNAIKFSPKGSEILISATFPPVCPPTHGQPCLCISVSDHGCGIPPEQQKILFNRYEQLPTATVYRKGTGLGLAICKEIVSLHNGDIWVESPVDANGGSRFTCALPIATTNSPPFQERVRT